MSRIELAVVLPVYNEEDAVGQVVEEWVSELEAQEMAYEIHAYNDGSTDGTLKILNGLASKYPNLIVHDKKNSGHGPAVIMGYRENSDKDWIFQTDSDGEIGPEAFGQLWRRRQDFDLLVGSRLRQKQPLARQLISFFSRLVVRLLYGGGVHDVNAPYRLMRAAYFKQLFLDIPDDTFAPNVIISGQAARRNARILEIPVRQKPRATGEVSLKNFKLLKAALRSLGQTVSFRLNHAV